MPCPEAFDLADQMPGVEHDTVADDAELARVHDSGRQKRQLVGLIADDEGVAGVVAALEAHDDVALGQPVDDLAFALVAPLGAHHHHIRHLEPRIAVPIWRGPAITYSRGEACNSAQRKVNSGQLAEALNTGD